MTRHIGRIGMLVLIALMTVAFWAPDQMLSVQVREGKLRDKPSFLGKIVATAAYGDRVTQEEERSGWMKVRGATGPSGWIHGSALSEKKIVLKSGTKDVETTASGDEIALAGKGFNEDVEREFRTAHPEAQFVWIDRMETWSVSAAQAMAFLGEGAVGSAAGGGE